MYFSKLHSCIHFNGIFFSSSELNYSLIFMIVFILTVSFCKIHLWICVNKIHHRCVLRVGLCSYMWLFSQRSIYMWIMSIWSSHLRNISLCLAAVIYLYVHMCHVWLSFYFCQINFKKSIYNYWCFKSCSMFWMLFRHLENMLFIWCRFLCSILYVFHKILDVVLLFFLFLFVFCFDL